VGEELVHFFGQCEVSMLFRPAERIQSHIGQLDQPVSGHYSNARKKKVLTLAILNGTGKLFEGRKAFPFIGSRWVKGFGNGVGETLG